MRSLLFLCVVPGALALQLPAHVASRCCSPPLTTNHAVPTRASNVEMIATFPPTLLRCVIGLGVIGAWVKNAWEKETDADRIYGKVHWFEPTDLNEDGCTLIGEEEGADGKMWFACNGKSSDAKMDCTRDESSFLPGVSESEALFLCKVPKPQDEP